MKAAAAIMICLIATGCEEPDQQTTAQIRSVRTILVGQDAASNQRTFTGVSRSAQESRLSFKVGGTVTEIPVTVGDNIKAGTVIARLDPSAYELQRQQAQASESQSRAEARNAKAAYQRTRSLYANNNVSLGELESARARSESADAQFRAANKSLQLADLNLSYTALAVDIDCKVDSIAISENENVQTGSEVARVNCSDELEIEVAVPESIISDFRRGKEAEIEFDAIATRSFKGIVIEVGVGADGVGSTFPVTVLVSDDHPSMRPGLAASVSFAAAQLSGNNFIVPLSAVVRRSGGTFVYTVNAVEGAREQGIVSLAQIELGELQTHGIEVISGLKKGDRVVIAGVSFLRDGLQVLF